MNELAVSKRPLSEDPDYWNVWIGKNDEGSNIDRQVDWAPIVEEWQKGGDEI
jgi:hypothetical protein